MIFPVFHLAQAQAPDPRLGQGMESLVGEFEAAFKARALGTISNPDGMPIQVTVNHSLKEGRRGHESARFKSFADLESWLRSKEHGGDEPGTDLLPSRVVSAKKSRRHETMEYENQGISHNTIYLARIRMSKGPKGISIVEVVFLNGD